MEKPQCAICQKEYRPRYPQEWFCNDCYHLYRTAIVNKEPWVKVCINTERARRFWDTYYCHGKRVVVQLVYLGEDDIYKKDDRYQIVNKFEEGEH